MILEKHGKTSLEIYVLFQILYMSAVFFLFFGAGRSTLV